MQMSPEQVEEQVKTYETKHTQFVAFAEALKTFLTQLLRVKEVGVVTIDARGKTVESFRGKIEREDKDYLDPINEITDLAGLRVVTYQVSDIETVSEIIEKNFNVDFANSIDKRQSIEADRFGYVSVHYVVSHHANRANLPEYIEFAGLRGEIQVRTVLQHAWAAIDHKLRYKSKEAIPARLRRQLYRISALLETADEEFESLTTRIAEVRENYSEAIRKGTLDIPLDVDSLGAYVEGSKNAEALFEAARGCDIEIAPHHPHSKVQEYSHLLAFLDLGGVKTIQEFDYKISSLSKEMPDLLSKITECWGETVSSPGLRLVVTRDSLLRMAYLLALSPEQAKRVRSGLHFKSKILGAIEQVYRSKWDSELPHGGSLG